MVVTQKLDCGSCEGRGRYTECDGAGGKWQERCGACAGTGRVDVMVLDPLVPSSTRDDRQAELHGVFPILSTYNTRTIDLAAAYQKACKAVQPVWKALLAELVTNVIGDHKAAKQAYKDAVQRAADARKALIEHAAGGHLEVGQ